MKTSTRFARPIVVVSGCLCGARCRWDGDSALSPFVRALKEHATIIPVCPEIEIGLGVPRERIVLVRTGARAELYQPSTARRLAQKMNRFSHQFLTRCGEVDGFILKHKSPSCGPRRVKLYESTDPDAGFVRSGVGLFARQVVGMWPRAASEDEERLADHRIREHWLTRLFTLAAWRTAKRQGSAASLRRFDEYHRSLIDAYNRRLARKMEMVMQHITGEPLRTPFSGRSLRTLPNRRTLRTPPNGHTLRTPPNGWGFQEAATPLSGETHPPGAVQVQVLNAYELRLFCMLLKPPRRTSLVKPFERALLHYSQFIRADERRRFAAQLKQYTAGDMPLSEIRKTVQVWAVRYDKSFVRHDSIFRPYPAPLAEA